MRFYVRSFDGVVDDEETPDSTRWHGEHDEAPPVFQNDSAKRVPVPSSATAAAAATKPQRSHATNKKESSAAAAAMGNLGSYTVSVETLQYQTESVLYMQRMQDYAGHQMNDGDFDQPDADEFAPAVPMFINNAVRAMPNDNYAVDEQQSSAAAAAAERAKSPPPLSLSALRPVLDEIVNAKVDDAKDQRIEQLEHENRVLWQVTKVITPPPAKSSLFDSVCSSILIQVVVTGFFLWLVYTYGPDFLGLCSCSSRR